MAEENNVIRVDFVAAKKRTPRTSTPKKRPDPLGFWAIWGDDILIISTIALGGALFAICGLFILGFVK